MTAFSLKTLTASWGNLQCEIRSVNNRYLETQFRLADELRSLEPAFKDALVQKIKRGKLECTFRFTPSTQQQTNINLNDEKLLALLSACKQVSTKFHQPSEINPLQILNWPGIIDDVKIDLQPILEAAKQLFDESLNDLITGRRAEGERLQTALVSRLSTMKKIVADEKERQPKLATAYREKLLQKITSVSLQYETERFEQELVYALNKMNVDEEIDRLLSHFEEIDNIFKRNEPVGRRLDFIMQELNREANTLGAKSIDMQTTKTSVELKVLIEQMREQVQNIE